MFFDTCVYHYPGVRLLLDVLGDRQRGVRLGDDWRGARRRRPRGHYFDDTKRYVDAIDTLSDEDRQTIYERNALKIYPRLARALGR